MPDERLSSADLTEVQRGLRMARPPDPEQLAAEKAMLAELDTAPAGRRTRGFLRLIGPGYLQSAMTLGGGTAVAALYAGAQYGYQLLWVAPVAMLLGIVMLAAISYQTLSTGARPLPAMQKYAGPVFANGWAFAALIASVIWHFPQYNLGASSLLEIGRLAGFFAPAGDGGPPTGTLMAMSVLVMFWAIALSFLYGTSARLVRVYERVLKYIVWGIVLCFLWVVLNTDTDWGGVAAGFVPFQFPTGGGQSSLKIAVSGVAAAVGVNMVFLYLYSLLARGWGREHRRLARFDLYTGMLLPYVLAASLMVIATANTLHQSGAEFGRNATISEAAAVLGTTIGPVAGSLVFYVGILGMALSTITLHMLVCGFVVMEWLGVPFGSRAHRLAMLIPIPGVLAPLLWGDLAVYLAIPTTIVCGFLIPLVYVGFIVLQRSRAYLGDDTPRGAKGKLWIAGMAVATLVLVAFLVSFLIEQIGKWLESPG